MELFDGYVHGHLDRRGFLGVAGKFAVGGMTAAMFLDVLSPRFAEAQIKPNDQRLEAGYQEFDSRQGSPSRRQPHIPKGHWWALSPSPGSEIPA